MKKLLILIFCFSILTANGQSKKIVIEVSNNWNKARTDAPVVVNLNALNLDFAVRSAIVKFEDVEIPSQLDDLTDDKNADELAFIADFSIGETKIFEVELSVAKSEKNYTSRVYAEMLISDKKGNHRYIESLTVPGTSDVYNQLHHHGPAFESELVAYRLYFDKKQTIDIYGKFNKGFEIKESQFYPTDEQLSRGFGDDVLRVSGSCGVGTLKGWNGKKAVHIEPVSTRTERIVAYGPVRAIVEVAVCGWEYQGAELGMINRYTLYAGHRDLQVDVLFSNPLGDEMFCTGVQDVKGSVSYSDHKGLIACWGTDWPVNDTVKYAKETVGLAAYVPEEYVKGEVKDKPNYLYLVGGKGKKHIRYYASFTSTKEKFGYKSPEAWFAYVKEWKGDLDNPVNVKIKE
ncbi:MAG: DUF4861 domain-containing protein [Culturomica sp.]|jgi:hypothetical protein|nr:DUF4861 domain-containing protein [Culturomica sp.]